MITKIYIGSSKLDLFEDENITLNLSVADVSDITKNTTDFTQSFNVPASDINNEIFSHYYEANLDGGFDARIKVDGRIELDGLPFKIGKFRLNGVKIKNGYPESYNINFWGNLVSIKDSVKNDELRDLDLSAFNHAYTSANVKEGLTTTTFTNSGAFTAGDVIYNLLVPKQYFYNGSGATASDSTNVSWTGTQGVFWSDLRPSLKLIRIIEAIETKYSLTFSRDFFGSTAFTGLYMLLNADDEEGNLNSSQIIDFTTKGTLEVGNATVDLDADSYFAGGGAFPLVREMHVEISPTDNSIEYRVVQYINGERWTVKPYASGVQTFEFRVYADDNTHTFFIEVKGSLTFTPTFTAVGLATPISGLSDIGTATMDEQSITLEAQTTSLLPKLKVIDFLKGLFNMFKLVVIPQDDGSIYVNTLKSYYEAGSIINASDYVDSNNYDVSRGEILNTIFYNFSEPQTLLQIEYDNQNNIYYGDAENYLYDSTDIATRELLDGEELKFEIPFEQVVYERLPDLNDLPNLTNIQYGAIIDENRSSVEIEPHIFYNINQNVSSKPLAFINSSSTREIINALNVPSHVDDNDSQQYSTVFASNANEWNGQAIGNTLYSNYHEEYITSIFDIKRRNFTFKAKNFPLNFLTTLELNDVIQIKGDYYRIDKYAVNLITGEATFNLINSVVGNINGFSPDRSAIITDYTAKTESINVVNLLNFSTAKVDTGDGITWVTITSSGTNIFFAFDENTTDEPRSMQVTVTNTDTLQDFTVTLTQNDSGITSFRYYLAKNTINFINFQ